jgi:flagellar basal-body rod modification protein FlgD
MAFAPVNLNGPSEISGKGTATSASSKKVQTAQDMAERFLKLMVTQVQNQDPLNPMDNAQMTSQMAQINTVSGIDKLNNTVKDLSSQFFQMQAMQSASLVGTHVAVPGNQMNIESGLGRGGFELAGSATQVNVDVMSPSGQVIDTLQLGAQTAGTHAFEWVAPNGVNNDSGLTFRVTASQDKTAVSSTALMRDRVEAVKTNGNSIELELSHSGNVAYANVKAFN